jgi:hypothetical protein
MTGAGHAFAGNQVGDGFHAAAHIMGPCSWKNSGLHRRYLAVSIDFGQSAREIGKTWPTGLHKNGARKP